MASISFPLSSMQFARTHQSKNPLQYQTGSWDVKTWKNSPEIEKLKLANSQLSLVICGDPDGKVWFILNYPPQNQQIENHLLQADLPIYRGTGSFTTNGPDELEKVYYLLIEHYGVVDQNQTIEQLVQFGSYDFSKSIFLIDLWDKNIPSLVPKKLEIPCENLEFVVHGFSNGCVSFAVTTHDLDRTIPLRQHLIEAGIDESQLGPYRVGTFITQVPKELPKIHQMLRTHYPFTETLHDTFIERLAACGNWKEEKQTRNVPLEKLDLRA